MADADLLMALDMLAEFSQDLKAHILKHGEWGAKRLLETNRQNIIEASRVVFEIYMAGVANVEKGVDPDTTGCPGWRFWEEVMKGMPPNTTVNTFLEKGKEKGYSERVSGNFLRYAVMNGHVDVGPPGAFFGEHSSRVH